jgi:hypothetical protein
VRNLRAALLQLLVHLLQLNMMLLLQTPAAAAR